MIIDHLEAQLWADHHDAFHAQLGTMWQGARTWLASALRRHPAQGRAVRPKRKGDAELAPCPNRRK